MSFFLILPLIAFFTILNIPYQIKKGKDGWAFISSCASLLLLLFLYGVGTFPVIVLSTIAPADHSLTIYNTAASSKTLTNLMIIVLIGIPLVFAYGVWIYRVFRGKVKIEEMSY